jgi:hypothetical protein
MRRINAQLEEISSKRIVEVMIEHALKKGHVEWKDALAAIYAVEPVLKDVSQERLARNWRTAMEQINPTQNNDKKQNPTQSNVESTQLTPVIVSPTDVEVVNPTVKTPNSATQVVINVGTQGVGGVNPNTTIVTGQSMGVESPKKSVKFTKATVKGLDEFVTEMLQRQISYEELVAAVEEIKGEALAALLRSVTDVILRCQRRYLSKKLILEALNDRYDSNFEALTCVIVALVKDDGGMQKGLEKAKLPVFSAQQLQQGTSTTPNNATSTPTVTPINASSTTGATPSTPPNASIDAAKARELLEQMSQIEVQHL